MFQPLENEESKQELFFHLFNGVFTKMALCIRLRNISGDPGRIHRIFMGMEHGMETVPDYNCQRSQQSFIKVNGAGDI